ncbi:MAG: amidase [Acidimicrobiales bacterium]
MTDTHGALLVGPTPLARPTRQGRLSGLTFVVKDLFDVAGERTGAGNPEILASAGPAADHAAAVRDLLHEGATCIGKAHTAETAYSLSALNDHHPTPRHPVDVRRDPGGSSSGSAVAVATGLCDIALGTDTAGSTRVPASYCGVIGMRPSHGRISLDGAFPLAPRFDTVGWFARDAEVARRVGRALLPPGGRRLALGRILVAVDLFAGCSTEYTDALYDALRGVGERVGRSPEPVRFCDDGDDEAWADTFRTLQRRDAWDAQGGLIEQIRSSLGPAVAPRWVEASEVTDADVALAEARAAVLAERLWSVVSDGAVLVLPSTPGAAPLLDLPEPERAAVRAATLARSAIAPIARCPEISLPLLSVGGLPAGVGFLAAPGADEMLLDLAVRVS